MTVHDAFLQGLAMVRKAGIPAKGNDIAVLAAHAVFTRRAEPVMWRPEFDEQAPVFAYQTILETYSCGVPDAAQEKA